MAAIADPPFTYGVEMAARLRLRAFRMDDAEHLYALFSDPQITRFWSFAAWTTPAQATAFIQLRLSLPPQSVSSWAIAHLHNDQLIGTVSLFLLSGEPRRGEIGYALIPAYQRQGLAQEALRLALSEAFETHGLQRVEADVDPRNQASWRLLEGLGFTLERIEPQRWRVGDEFADSAIYVLSAPRSAT